MCSGFAAACAGAVYLLNTDLVEIRFRLAVTLVYADECRSANIQRIFRSSGDSVESSLKSAPLVRWSRGRWVIDTLKSVSCEGTALHCVKSVGCVEEAGGGSLSFEKDRMKIMPKIITLIGLIAVLTGCQSVALQPWPPTPSPSMSLNSLQDPESGWAIIDEEAKVRLRDRGCPVYLSHRRRLAAVSEVACKPVSGRSGCNRRHSSW